MKKLLSIMIALFFSMSLAHGESYEKSVSFIIFPDKFYVYIHSFPIGYDLDTSALYDGVEFPLYVGYVIIEDETITFVKKTALPVQELVDYFDEIKKAGSVKPPESITEKPKPRVPITDPMFVAILHQAIDLYYTGIFVVGFTGNPDENYKPVFTETCIYRTSPRKPCSLGDFSTLSPRLLLIPTSNVVKERRAYHLGPRRETRLERYNDRTKQWDDIGAYHELRTQEINRVLESINSEKEQKP